MRERERDQSQAATSPDSCTGPSGEGAAKKNLAGLEEVDLRLRNYQLNHGWLHLTCGQLCSSASSSFLLPSPCDCRARSTSYFHQLFGLFLDRSSPLNCPGVSAQLPTATAQTRVHEGVFYWGGCEGFVNISEQLLGQLILFPVKKKQKKHTTFSHFNIVAFEDLGTDYPSNFEIRGCGLGAGITASHTGTGLSYRLHVAT